jgi:hypothetical protein
MYIKNMFIALKIITSIKTQFMNHQIKNEISNSFDFYLNKYDEVKYPPGHYQDFKEHFSNKNKNVDFKLAMEWKYGHINKKNYPQSHKAIITKSNLKWMEFISIEKALGPRETFHWWHKELGKTAFITAAWITHLIHHKLGVPIIDQHNFRAMHLLTNTGNKTIPSFKRKPSNWDDLQQLSEFIEKLKIIMPTKSLQEIDRFLMMYGKYNPSRR